MGRIVNNNNTIPNTMPSSSRRFAMGYQKVWQYAYHTRLHTASLQQGRVKGRRSHRRQPAASPHSHKATYAAMKAFSLPSASTPWPRYRSTGLGRTPYVHSRATSWPAKARHTPRPPLAQRASRANVSRQCGSPAAIRCNVSQRRRRSHAYNKGQREAAATAKATQGRQSAGRLPQPPGQPATAR